MSLESNTDRNEKIAESMKGNTNAAKGKVWNDALRKAIAQNPHKVRAAVEQLLDLAADGEAWAIKELADRLDGKSMQSTDITSSDGTVINGIMMSFVEPDANKD
jgi:oligoendopeptidase F